MTSDIYYVLINLHVDRPEIKPEFFVMTGDEALILFKNTPKHGPKRAYLDYLPLVRMKTYQDRWSVFGSPELLQSNLKIAGNV